MRTTFIEEAANGECRPIKAVIDLAKLNEKGIDINLLEPDMNLFYGDAIHHGNEHRYFDHTRRGDDGDLPETLPPVEQTFAKLSIGEYPAVCPELSTSEKVLLNALLPKVMYQSNMICHENRKELLAEDMVELSGLSLRTVEEGLRTLREKNIIYKGRNGRGVQYFMNPWMSNRGYRINKTLLYMFRNYKIRTKGGMTWEEYEMAGRDAPKQPVRKKRPRKRKK